MASVAATLANNSPAGSPAFYPAGLLGKTAGDSRGLGGVEETETPDGGKDKDGEQQKVKVRDFGGKDVDELTKKLDEMRASGASVEACIQKLQKFAGEDNAEALELAAQQLREGAKDAMSLVADRKR